MGMRIASSATASATQATSASNWQRRQQGVKSLFSALQSGDLAAAQKSYAGLSKASGGVNATSALGQIGQALQAGDLAGAQKVAQSMRSSHRGHHHAAPAATTAPAAPESASGSGSLLDVVA
jgi:hypothetical protein